MPSSEKDALSVVYEINPAMPAAFREPLIEWFQHNQRDLPWRGTDRDPYAVWLSEIMLQQTRVDQMLPFYRRFLNAYPTICSLASASLDDVLLLWEGLGYYSRCRNLHKAAQIVCENHAGVLPGSATELETLPGIGPYTAAAIASTVYGEVRPAIDGNVKRVLSRVFTIEESIDSTDGLQKVAEAAARLIDITYPGEFNESMMELGATICLPREPLCPDCPVNTVCTAFRTGTQMDFPRRSARKKVPTYEIAVAIVFDVSNRIFIQRRPENGMLGGLWEFPGGKRKAGEPLEKTCLRELSEETGFSATITGELDTVRHAYSHLKVKISPFVCRLDEQSPPARISISEDGTGTPGDFRWIEIDEIRDFAFPRANRKIFTLLEHYLESGIERT
ncbi:MAG: A/G-specific adenine glycosylase [Rhodothermales bacterium]|nr:A/G-specific adenine glycosylase [Rhodothermales bacterium]